MSLRCLFVVQGEGRGHLTQALALKELLEGAGHRVTRVLFGRSPRRDVPGFFRRKIGAPLTLFDSPNFFVDDRERGVEFAKTIWKNVPLLRRFGRSFSVIDRVVQRDRPDVIINFYEVMAGLYNALYRPRAPMVAVAHQYMFAHPAYRFPENHFWNRQVTRGFTAVTHLGAAKRLALSLYPAPHQRRSGLVVVPPLLRRRLFDLPAGEEQAAEEPFFLLYLLNSGYAEEVIRWHRRRPEVRLHCFWDRAEAAPVEQYDDTLTFHRLDDEKFLTLMARCRGLATTAGFESVGEAMYLGKPVLMVPVEGHYEQRCNALDGQRAGAGIAAERFDRGLDRLVARADGPHQAALHFRRWLEGAGARFVREIEATAGQGRVSVAASPPAGDGTSKEAMLQTM